MPDIIHILSHLLIRPLTFFQKKNQSNRQFASINSCISHKELGCIMRLVYIEESEPQKGSLTQPKP